MEDLVNELKPKIIETLNLEGVEPSDINEEEPLFGTGLGLDSIDALELVAMLEQQYNIVIQDRREADRAFASVRALAAFVWEQKRQACS